MHWGSVHWESAPRSSWSSRTTCIHFGAQVRRSSLWTRSRLTALPPHQRLGPSPISMTACEATVLPWDTRSNAVTAILAATLQCDIHSPTSVYLVRVHIYIYIRMLYNCLVYNQQLRIIDVPRTIICWWMRLYNVSNLTLVKFKNNYIIKYDSIVSELKCKVKELAVKNKIIT